MDKSMTGDMDNLPEEDKIRMSAMIDQLQIHDRFFLFLCMCVCVEKKVCILYLCLQSMIGQKMLEFQLRRLGVFNAEETISKHPNLDENFKILWANHGDDISIQYSGTPALKGDFVRYGKRTVKGILNDGRNALMRYYLNNFCDGTKQDATDLLHGHYIVSASRDMTQTSQKGGVEAVASFPMAFGLILIGFFFTIISLRRVQYNPWNLLFSMIWASISLGIAGFVKANGRVFCNRPRLNQPRR